MECEDNRRGDWRMFDSVCQELCVPTLRHPDMMPSSQPRQPPVRQSTMPYASVSSYHSQWINTTAPHMCTMGPSYWTMTNLFSFTPVWICLKCSSRWHIWLFQVFWIDQAVKSWLLEDIPPIPVARERGGMFHYSPSLHKVVHIDPVLSPTRFSAISVCPISSMMRKWESGRSSCPNQPLCLLLATEISP